MKTSNLYAVATKDQPAPPPTLSQMEAIACGVHARFEERTGYFKKITDTTINVAKALGVPENEINSWAASRATQMTHEMEKLQEIKSLLEKYYGNSLGITV